jgi:hypothetical protein
LFRQLLEEIATFTASVVLASHDSLLDLGKRLLHPVPHGRWNIGLSAFLMVS